MANLTNFFENEREAFSIVIKSTKIHQRITSTTLKRQDSYEYRDIY